MSNKPFILDRESVYEPNAPEKTPEKARSEGCCGPKVDPSGCCGGPAESNADACCALDETIKSEGGSGCGCR